MKNESTITNGEVKSLTDDQLVNQDVLKTLTDDHVRMKAERYETKAKETGKLLFIRLGGVYRKEYVRRTVKKS